MFRKILEVTRAPSAKAIALRELEAAQRSLLEAHSAVEFSTAMVSYHTKRVARLIEYTGRPDA